MLKNYDNKTNVLHTFIQVMEHLIQGFVTRQIALTTQPTTAKKQGHAIKTVLALLPAPIDACSEALEDLLLKMEKTNEWVANTVRIYANNIIAFIKFMKMQINRGAVTQTFNQNGLDATQETASIVSKLMKRKAEARKKDNIRKRTAVETINPGDMKNILNSSRCRKSLQLLLQPPPQNLIYNPLSSQILHSTKTHAS
jgi:hypothetical protein